MCYQGDAEKAKTYLDSMEQIIRKIRESSYYFNFGFIMEQLNKRKEAKEAYQIGLRRTPDSKPLQ